MSEKEILLEAGTNELEIIEFYVKETLPGEDGVRINYFGVNVAKVLEVIESPKLESSKSAAHPCFLGAIPLREKILPVLDLSIWLNLTRQKQEHEIILVTEFNSKITGFLASGVTQIYRVGWHDVEPPGRYISSVDSNCLNGIVKLEDHFVLLLDLEKILAEFDPDFGGKLTQRMHRSSVSHTALIVDDSKIMREMIRERLEEANFKILMVDDGEEAWQLLENYRDQVQGSEERIDIVISDIEMPRLDGFALTKRIKTDQALRKLPVVLFSSLITEALRHKGMSVGADDQVGKPEFVQLGERALALIERLSQSASD